MGSRTARRSGEGEERLAAYCHGFCAALLAVLAFASGARAEQITARLSAGPRLVGTRDFYSGSGTVTANIDDHKLTISGSFRQLLSPATSARVLRGPAIGVRGPAIFTLSAPEATSGKLSGSFDLTDAQIADLRAGLFYVEIDSAKAPEGDVWGWLLTPQATFQ
jgi:hypothetical protein